MLKLIKYILGALLFLAMVSFQSIGTLKGTWIYAGDIFNGKKEGAPKEYTLERKYSDTGFTAIVLEKGYKPEEYETGTYKLNADTCFETQTWCSQPSNLLNVTIHYHYIIRNDTLILNGVLPSGASTEEYWKRMK
jgi:hypothetical protein